MCGRISRAKREPVVDTRWGKLPVPFEQRNNIGPGQQLSIVLVRDGALALEEMEWGLPAPWEPKQLLVNARAEGVEKKSTFKAAANSRRCLVIADGWYEWLRAEGTKRPFRFIRADEQPFAIAALWFPPPNQAPDSKKKPVSRFITLTVSPDDQCRAIHDRMPLVLSPLLLSSWLDPAMPFDPLWLLGGMRDCWDIYEVSGYVNNARNQGPECLQRLNPPPPEHLLLPRQEGYPGG